MYTQSPKATCLLVVINEELALAALPRHVMIRIGYRPWRCRNLQELCVLIYDGVC